LFEERFVFLAKDHLGTQHVSKTEQQLQSAVEEEDYELADQLVRVAEQARKEGSGLMLQKIFKALAQLDSQKELIVQSIVVGQF
jgi:hypothetical protein